MAQRKRKETKKKYFWRDMYIGTIPDIVAELKKALALAGATNLQMLDQQTMSQETLCNALFLWLAALADREGARGIERELAPAFERLNALVACDMKKQEGGGAASPAPEKGKAQEPEGFSRPKGARPGPGTGPGGRLRRPRNGRISG